MNTTTFSLMPKSPVRQIAQRGFTVIELMVVIAIVGVVLAIAGPSFEMIRSMRVKNAASEVQMALMLARSEAIKRNATVSISPTGSGGVWDEGWELKVGSTVLQATALTNITVSGVTGVISFNAVGRPNVAASFTVSAPNAPEIRCVTVNSSGRSAIKNGEC